eukprot:Blabericola_migrator_1__345@NODE_1088_length_5485_cov_101_249354_g746_i0_p6_GENE_NODE_1088_length_5485_cov_101_249354_g746_i0NODE_1088_length_5485_cov_101_249354_g746_i0_p6_ORF_typecomplete_len118_score14_40An_peroxidase/PF03098_15/0_13_NODE_1088_length_5485_cov_101_249354_g746_i039824335
MPLSWNECFSDQLLLRPNLCLVNSRYDLFPGILHLHIAFARLHNLIIIGPVDCCFFGCFFHTALPAFYHFSFILIKFRFPSRVQRVEERFHRDSSPALFTTFEDCRHRIEKQLLAGG